MKVLIVSLILTTSLCAQVSQKKEQSRQYYAAVFSRGEHWDMTKQPNEQTYFYNHGKNMQRLRTEGKIALGGRFGELGLVVFNSGSEAEVRSFFSSDSLVLKNILKMELHVFQPFYKGCIE